MKGAHVVYAYRGLNTKGILLLPLPAEWLLRMHAKLIPQLFTCISAAAAVTA